MAGHTEWCIRLFGSFQALLYIGIVLSNIGAAHSSPVTRAKANIFPQYDVLIYGATPAAMAAAIQTARMNRTVAIVCPSNHIGGLTTSGLGWTDSKDGNAIGGISREFYARVYNYYKPASAWFEESRAAYVNKRIAAQPGPAIDDSKQVQWTFEPHVAEEIFENWMEEMKVPIFRNEALDRTSNGVTKDATKIVSLKTESGRSFTASMFIDASYEGDLMATAGVPWRIGRESQSEYGESLAGIRIDTSAAYGAIDPYVVRGQTKSGLLPGIQRVIADDKGLDGSADPYRLQSYNYRVSLTKNSNIKVPFSQPFGYDESAFELLFRYIEAGYTGPFFTSQLMPNGKTDSNANGRVSTDLMGGNYNDRTLTNYATYDYEQRAQTAQKHRTYAEGFFWTLANHPRVPQAIRTATSQWGYASDEWKSNGNWPYEIYIREARRMRGAYTVTQSDAQQSKAYPNDSVVGLGSYSLDCHEVERVVVDSHIYDEGLVHVANPTPFAIPFASIVPTSSVATNFLNPVTMSATHVAYASIRLEPTYMILGQSAATAAVLAIEQGVKIQDVDRKVLSARLAADKQVLK